MDLKETREKSKKMLANFLNEIGLDGEAYVANCNNCPMVWGNPKFNTCGEFVAPESKRLEGILKSLKVDERTKSILNKSGVILINKNYKQKEADADFFVTLIHETIHSNRNLLLFDATRDNKNENAYSFINKFDQNISTYNFTYADASQKILKGNIDNSKKTVDSYENITSEKLEKMESEEGKIGAQMEKQYKIDEALVEIMSVLSYYLYKDKERGKDTHIWDMMAKIKKMFKEEYDELIEMDLECRELGKDTIKAKDKIVMCDFILRHHDFELFNWMIDPIEYSLGDVHYDFFKDYSKNDKDLLDKLYNDEWSNDFTFVDEITFSDMKNVANSETAMEELEGSSQDIINAQNRDDIENERG